MKIIDLNVIKKNYLNISNLIGNKNIYAVIKSNAYDLGAPKIFEILYQLGCNNFCVNTINEALEIRRINQDAYILLLSDFDPNDIDLLKENNISVTISNVDKIKYLDNNVCELKINTGLNRYGIEADKANYAIENIKNLKGIYTHISNYNCSYFYDQYDLFKKYAKGVMNAHYITSLGLNKETYFYNSVRIGMGLYKNCLNIVEPIKRINYVKKNERVGYDYVTEDDIIVGIINIGYYNGLSIKNKGRLVYILNNYYKIISICMNHCFIKIDSRIKVNDMVELLGSNVKISYIAEYLDIGEYEVFTSFRNMEVNYLDNL